MTNSTYCAIYQNFNRGCGRHSLKLSNSSAKSPTSLVYLWAACNSLCNLQCAPYASAWYRMQWGKGDAVVNPKAELCGLDRELKFHSENPSPPQRISFYNDLTWGQDLACIDSLHRILFLYLNSGECRLHIHKGIRITLPQTIFFILISLFFFDWMLKVSDAIYINI